MKKIIIYFYCCCLSLFELKAQNLQANIPVFEEYLRREQLLNDRVKSSFLLRPLAVSDSLLGENIRYTYDILKQSEDKPFRPTFQLLPMYAATMISSGKPYPEVSKFLQSKGFQHYFSTGFFSSLGPLTVQIQPEFFYSQNLAYEVGFYKSGNIEYLEYFGKGAFRRFLPGQSSVRLNVGAFSLGASTENIWWGPGQFNSLIFSTNAFGFQHLTFNTRRPVQTFLGSFEGQLIVGKLQGADPDVVQNFNLRDDWRYLNGITFSYQPRWIKGLYVGISRVFQQYNSNRTNSFGDLFPIFEAFQKVNLVDDVGNSLAFDERGQDQQLTGFVRYLFPKANAELYFEYGRRDHALNWREFILNPEHARGYLFGFKKIWDVTNDAHLQVRGEILQQQESVNILVRYPDTGGGGDWGGNGWIPHGFSHRGQMLGPGVGPSSNIQSLEAAWVKGFNKLGLRFERLNRHQDMYQKVFLDPSEQGRWVDLSARILADWQFNNLIVSSSVNFVQTHNYQWQLDPASVPSFPLGVKLVAVHSQVSLIYLWKKD